MLNYTHMGGGPDTGGDGGWRVEQGRVSIGFDGPKSQ